MGTNRRILHIDMDAFYASVEQRDSPELKGKPVIVGGEPGGRGVVAACSYEAREFGLHSAMSSTRAYHLCPHAIFVKPRFDVYKETSQKIMEIFRSFTDILEPMSLDEAYLDITEKTSTWKEAEETALSIKNRIKEETGLTASAGVSFNKFLAKVASSIFKPDGLKVIGPEEADGFIDGLPIRKFYGIGEATEKKMIDRGILNGADLKKFSKPELVRLFGRHGAYYHDIANCLYDSPVTPYHERKSIGSERTLTEDIDEKEAIMEVLTDQVKRLENSMKKRDIKGRTLTLKLRYSDFTRITRSMTVKEPIVDSISMMRYIPDLLERTQAGRLKVRLLGIAVSNLIGVENSEGRFRQLTLDYWA